MSQSCNKCSNKASKRSMCETHYRRWWRAKNPDKNKAIQLKADAKKKAKNGHWSNKEVECYLCKSMFTKSGPNQKYCSKYCQNKIFFKKKMENPEHKLRHNLRSRLRKSIHGRPGGLSPVRSLGCSVKELREHLESQFQLGMSWGNYGKWHIDHIKPLASFNLTKQNEFKEACHYTNLQPLWAKDNLSKGTDEY